MTGIKRGENGGLYLGRGLVIMIGALAVILGWGLHFGTAVVYPSLMNSAETAALISEHTKMCRIEFVRLWQKVGTFDNFVSEGPRLTESYATNHEKRHSEEYRELIKMLSEFRRETGQRFIDLEKRL